MGIALGRHCQHQEERRAEADDVVEQRHSQHSLESHRR